MIKYYFMEIMANVHLPSVIAHPNLDSGLIIVFRLPMHLLTPVLWFLVP